MMIFVFTVKGHFHLETAPVKVRDVGELALFTVLASSNRPHLVGQLGRGQAPAAGVQVITVKVEIDVGTGSNVSRPHRTYQPWLELREWFHDLQSCLTHRLEANLPLFTFGGLGDVKELSVNLLVGRKNLAPQIPCSYPLCLEVLLEITLV
jgi:hypothetical protein